MLNKSTLEGIEEHAANFNKPFKQISSKTYDALDHRCVYSTVISVHLYSRACYISLKNCSEARNFVPMLIFLLSRKETLYFYFRRPDFDKDYKIYKNYIANNELLLENFILQVNILFIYYNFLSC